MAGLAFQPQNLLFGSFGVLSENRLRLSTVTTELHMISSLSESFGVTLASFVLSNLVLSVSFATLVLAESTSYFRDVDHLSY